MHVYWSNRSEQLVEALYDVLRAPSSDPFQPEMIGVHSAGVGQWLSIELSRMLGVCAGLRFASPEELIHEAIVAVLGDDAKGFEKWLPEQLRWAVLDLLPQMIDRPELGHIAGALRDDPALAAVRSSHLALQIARSIHRYLTYRQGMIRRWSKGLDAGWQSELYRALRDRLGVPDLAELSQELIRRCHEPDLSIATQLPQRLCLFGVTTLAPSIMRAFSALARHVEIHLFVQRATATPSRLLKTEESRDDESPDRDIEPPLRSSTELEADHPLLVSMGRLSRELQALWDELVDTSAPPRDLGTDPCPLKGTTTMLGVLQADIFHRRCRGSAATPQRWTVDRRDRTISVHSCHGTMRQIEVLRDQLLALFEEHRDIEPRDVIVMSPDIESHAPLIKAVFDERSSSSPSIPYRIADISPRRKSQVLESFFRIIDMAGARMTGPEVLDLLAMEPVRRRFDISEEELDQIIEWIEETGVRWGIDANHRERHGQPPYVENTWRFGLDRLLIGYALPGQGRFTFRDVLPYDEVEGGLGTLLGRFVELCHRLFEACAIFDRGPRPLTEWRDHLAEIASDLLSATGSAAEEHELLRSTLGAFVDEATSVGFDKPIELDAVRALLVDRLSKADEASGFLTGKLTFCGMVPLRNVPARVVCLLGMDDGAFPRPSSLAGFDHTLTTPRLCDRSERDEDRQLFLDALLSARDRVLIFTSGRSVKNDQPLPPATVVSELVDILASSFVLSGTDGGDDDVASRAACRQAMIHHLVVQHPLHPFSPKSYGASRDERLFTFTKSYLAGARASLAARHGPRPFIDVLLSPNHEEMVSLSSVLEFFEQPLRAMLDRRVGVRFSTDEVMLDDHEPLELDGLERYRIARPLLDHALHGAELWRAYAVVKASGALPWGTPGRCAFDQIVNDVKPVAHAVLQLRAGSEALPPIALDLVTGGYRLTGHIDSIRTKGLITYRYARFKASHLLSAWLTHLTLGALRPTEAQSSYFVSRALEGPEASTHELRPPAEPRALLDELLGIYREGQTAPLMFFPETSKAYADVVFLGGDGDITELNRRGLTAARTKWQGSGSTSAPPGEGADRALRRVFGVKAPFDIDLSLPGVDQPERAFRELALAVYGPLLKHVDEVT